MSPGGVMPKKPHPVSKTPTWFSNPTPAITDAEYGPKKIKISSYYFFIPYGSPLNNLRYLSAFLLFGMQPSLPLLEPRTPYLARFMI